MIVLRMTLANNNGEEVIMKEYRLDVSEGLSLEKPYSELRVTLDEMRNQVNGWIWDGDQEQKRGTV